MTEILGVGRISLHICNSGPETTERIRYLQQAGILVPQAVFQIHSSTEVLPAGVLLFPNKKTVQLFSGGALTNASEVISASVVMSKNRAYVPEDFALS